MDLNTAPPQIKVIGDAVVDHFISIPDEYVETYCNLNDHTCELSIPYGAKIPVGDVQMMLGGNAANVSVALKRMGVTVMPVIPLGENSLSVFAQDKLRYEGLTNDPANIQDSYGCNSSYILRYSGERTIFSHHVTKSYDLLEEVITPYVYLSTHSADNTSFSTEVLLHTSVNHAKLLFAPGNTQIKGDTEILEALIIKSELVSCNRSEAFDILKKIDGEEMDIVKMMHRFAHLGVKKVVITDGANGVNFFNSETEETGHLPSEINPAEIVDTTGAGDALCSGIIYSLIKNMTLSDGVKLGLKNSSSVLKAIGAQTGLIRMG